jgi:hypothetical protein
MNNKWVINKLAAILTSIAVILAFIKYYRIYNFNIPQNDRLVFWVPVTLAGVVGLIIYVWTFKAKKD